MAKETEIRALVDDQFSIHKKLIEQGFVKSGEIEQTDIMLDHPDGALFKSGKKIRLRLQNKKAVLTYKGKFEGDSTASRRTEVNINVSESDAGELVLLFEALGFPALFTIPKKRTSFSKDNVSVTFDDWPIIGCMMEIEGEESEIKPIADELAPGTEFKNYRLKELFEKKILESGKSFLELKSEYEMSTGNSLGNLEVLLN